MPGTIADQKHKAPAGPICGLCKNTIEEPVKITLECGHLFHGDGCLVPWTKQDVKNNVIVVDKKSLPGHKLYSDDTLFKCPTCQVQYCVGLAKVDPKTGEFHMHAVKAVIKFSNRMIEVFASLPHFVVTYGPYFASRHISVASRVIFSVCMKELKEKSGCVSFRATNCTCKNPQCSKAMMLPEAVLVPVGSVCDGATFAQGLAYIESLHGSREAMLADLLTE